MGPYPDEAGRVEPWLAELKHGSAEAAWDAFVTRYRRLMFAAIRHTLRDYDDVMDAFTHACGALRANDFARLRRCADRFDPARPFSTLLVVIVRNLTIDWLRHREGRARISAAEAALPELERQIFHYVFVDRRSHVEAYELLRTREDAHVTFSEFRRALASTYRAVKTMPGVRGLEAQAAAAAEPEADTPDPAVIAEQQALAGDLLATLEPEDRLAVQLYVVDEMPADQVARALGWPNAKAVYNRVYRALASLRERLAASGLRRGEP